MVMCVSPITIYYYCERRLYSFYSMFKYWKAGAVDGLYKRTPAFKAKYANVFTDF
jgi:hypothetical protein